MTSVSSKLGPRIWSHDTGQQIPCFDRCQLTIVWMSIIKDVCCESRLYASFNLVVGVWLPGSAIFCHPHRWCRYSDLSHQQCCQPFDHSQPPTCTSIVQSIFDKLQGVWKCYHCLQVECLVQYIFSIETKTKKKMQK